MRGKRNSPCEKEKFDLTLAVPFRQNWHSFMHPLTVNTWWVRSRGLTLYLLLASWHHRNQQYKNTDLRLINHRKRLVCFNTLSGRSNHFIWIQVEILHPQNDVELRNKFKIQKLSWSIFFLLSGIPLQPSTNTE